MQPFWYKHTKLRQHRWIHQIDCQLEPRSLTNSCCTIEVLPGTQGKLMLLALGFPWFFHRLHDPKIGWRSKFLAQWISREALDRLNPHQFFDDLCLFDVIRSQFCWTCIWLGCSICKLFTRPQRISTIRWPQSQ